MKLKFESAFCAGMVFLLVILAWSVWAAAQPATNSPARAVTNGPPALVRNVEQFDQRYLTFGLDQVEDLREHYLFGEPLWKYPASLIYILLAFGIARIIDLAAFSWLKRLAARTETKLDDLLLELLRGPIKVIAFVVFLHLGLTIFDWSATARTYFSK